MVVFVYKVLMLSACFVGFPPSCLSCTVAIEIFLKQLWCLMELMINGRVEISIIIYIVVQYLTWEGLLGGMSPLS